MCVYFLALSVTLMPGTPARAAASPQQVLGRVAFTLDKREAAKGETVVAAYELNQPARQVTLTATNFDGAPVGFKFPQAHRANASRASGVISFVVPAEAGSLSPLLLTLNVDGELRGLQRLIVKCDSAWFFAPRIERCPYAPVQSTPAAIQRFERGTMIWLQATDSIYVLYDAVRQGAGNDFVAGFQLERYDDQFIEGSPEPISLIKPPAGKYRPVRGFGLVWRTTIAGLTNLGWALEPERGYTACYGDAFGGGKSMRSYVSTPEQKLLEFDSYYAPTRWRELNQINDQTVTIVGCGERSSFANRQSSIVSGERSSFTKRQS